MKSKSMAAALAVAISVAFLTPLAGAQDAPRLLALDIESDIVYGHKMGMALTLDVIKPADPNGCRGSVHGQRRLGVSLGASRPGRTALRGPARQRLHRDPGAPRLEPALQGS